MVKNLSLYNNNGKEIKTNKHKNRKKKKITVLSEHQLKDSLMKIKTKLILQRKQFVTLNPHRTKQNQSQLIRSSSRIERPIKRGKTHRFGGKGRIWWRRGAS